MAGCIMQKLKDPRDLKSYDLREEALKNLSLEAMEAYTVLIDGQAERAEVLYFGDRDIAGVAWGAEPNWLENIASAEEACRREFGELRS